MTPAARKAAFKARQERIIATQSRPGLTVCERLVIAIIGQQENLETGQCDPGVETIARESGLHDRAVYRAIAGAESKGALVITRTGSGGRNGRNSYRLCGGNPDKSSGLNPDKETLTKRSKNPDKVSPELNELPPSEEPKGSSYEGEGESDRPLADDPPPPDAGAFEGAAPEEDQQGVPSPSAEIQPPPRSKPDGRKVSFAALRRVWARPWADADDDVAFSLYCAACGGRARRDLERGGGVGRGRRCAALPAVADEMAASARLGETAAAKKPANGGTPRRASASPRSKRGAAHAMFMAGQED